MKTWHDIMWFAESRSFYISVKKKNTGEDHTAVIACSYFFVNSSIDMCKLFIRTSLPKSLAIFLPIKVCHGIINLQINKSIYDLCPISLRNEGCSMWFCMVYQQISNVHLPLLYISNKESFNHSTKGNWWMTTVMCIKLNKEGLRECFWNAGLLCRGYLLQGQCGL